MEQKLIKIAQVNGYIDLRLKSSQKLKNEYYDFCKKNNRPLIFIEKNIKKFSVECDLICTNYVFSEAEINQIKDFFDFVHDLILSDTTHSLGNIMVRMNEIPKIECDKIQDLCDYTAEFLYNFTSECMKSDS